MGFIETAFLYSTHLFDHLISNYNVLSGYVNFMAYIIIGLTHAKCYGRVWRIPASFSVQAYKPICLMGFY